MSVLWIYHGRIDPHAGGTERATHLVMSALAKSGHEIAGALAFRQEHPRIVLDSRGKQVRDLYAYLKRHGVHVVVNQIGYSTWLLDEFLARGGQRWHDEGGRIVTCLHFDPEMFSETVSSLARHWHRKTMKQKLRRVARIVHLPVARWRASRLRNMHFRRLIRISDHYVILSEKHRQRLCDLSRTRLPQRILVIPNLLTYAESIEANRLPEKKKVALIVSRLDEPQKRISLALKAWARIMKTGSFDDWRLEVVGDGEYADDYREFVVARGIPNVVFCGAQDPEKYYDSAAIYLHTAAREGWGLTITEAMQKGVVPVVMNSSGVFRELICDGRSGVLVRDGDVRAFSKAVAALMASAADRERIARAALEQSRTRNNETIIQQWSFLLAARD